MSEQMTTSGSFPYLIGNVDERRAWVTRRSLFFFPATLLVIAIADFLLPPQRIDGSAERLAFALRWSFVALVPFVAVWVTILIERLREGAHNPLLGVESHRLKIHCRVMQNTLEQFVILAVSVLAAASTLSSAHLQLIPTLCTAFVVARFVYWKGYLNPQNCLARTPGTQIGSAINCVALGAAAQGLLAG